MLAIIISIIKFFAAKNMCPNFVTMLRNIAQFRHCRLMSEQLRGFCFPLRKQQENSLLPTDGKTRCTRQSLIRIVNENKHHSIDPCIVCFAKQIRSNATMTNFTLFMMSSTISISCSVLFSLVYWVKSTVCWILTIN